MAIYILLPEAIETLKAKLIPLATIITPNLPEGYALTIKTKNMKMLAQKLLEFGSKAVLLKGGHLINSKNSDDFYLDVEGNSSILKNRRICSKNTHGTGCTLSAAIAAGLARDLDLLEACKAAKSYLFNALSAAQNFSVGKGHGPVDHLKGF